jgi:hypothetical protein
VGAARFAVACLAATGLAACGLAVNGLEGTVGEAGVGVDAAADVTTAEASAEASGADTSAAPEASSSDAATDVVVAEAATVDGCVSTGTEDCTNGMDDNCNGLVDCEDPVCMGAGYTCVPIWPDPTGWNFVAFDATSQTGCPPTLTQTSVAVDPTNPPPPAACGCTCSVGTLPSCEQGNIAVNPGTNNMCSAMQVNAPANGGACNPQNAAPLPPYLQATQPPPSGGTCTGATTTTLPPAGATQGEVCNGETAFGAGCPAMQQCALAPPGFSACIHHGGANMACPTAFPTQNSVGTLMDTRGCGGNCTCGTPTGTCSVGGWAFYTSANCTGAAGVQLQTNGMCNQNGDTTTPFMSNKFFSSFVGTCGAPTMTPMPTGTVTLTGEDTICCE